MCDRFQFIDEPPVIVGSCTVCHDDIQAGYDKNCEFCGEMLCEDCIHECWVCQRKGGAWCINKKDCNKEYICDECVEKREALIDQVGSGVDIPDYYFSGERQTDEETILEYNSADLPGIEVRIKKVREQ